MEMGAIISVGVRWIKRIPDWVLATGHLLVAAVQHHLSSGRGAAFVFLR